MTIALGILFLITQIVSIVLFIMVLVKLFKQEGALKGILGFFCGIYTFIWGWMKHKELALTRVMTVWSIITVVSMVLPSILATSGAYELMNFANNFKGDVNLKMMKQDSAKKAMATNLTQLSKIKKANAVEKIAVNKPMKKDANWSQKALALWDDGKYKNPNKAIDYWNRGITNNQNAAKAYNNRGLAYHNLNQYQRAIKDYSRALQLDSSYVAALNNRGNSYYELTEYQLALKDFNRSIQVKPNYSIAHLNRGLVYYQMEKNDEACQDFQKACDLKECDGINWAMKNGLCN